jgi:hypothetical protein
VIFDKIAAVLLGVLNGVLGLLPSWSLGLDLSGWGEGFGSALAMASGWFPVGILGTCLLTILGLKAALFGWDLLVFLYRLIPGKLT